MTHEQQRKERVETLAKKWIHEGVPHVSEFAELTPDEAWEVAFKAGYNTNHNLDVAIREGCAKSAKQFVIPKD